MPEQQIRSVKAQEKIWKEEDDVRTLSHAQEIQKDRPRLTAATKRATIMAKDVKAQAVKLENVAKKKPVKKASTKRTVSRTVGGRRRR
ncbi:hypothetical protein LCGC14_1550920 [marine sediment metagenome]|uniref:Uncharacterized protein n=1 Tax=marine sediment metagenome TaxID=412755 RepID=A0A0F9JBB5_9ZZZZ